MAKHRKGRRRYRPYIKGQISTQLGMGALGALALIGVDVSDTVEEKAWLSSVRATWSLKDWTTGSQEGPILVGVCHSNYTNSEIEAWIENTQSWTTGDLVAQEVAKRKIRRVGIFSTPTGVNLSTQLNDGRPITTKCGWMLNSGNTVRIWAYNLGASPITTGAEVSIEGHANLWPA